MLFIDDLAFIVTLKLKRILVKWKGVLIGI